MLPRLVDALYLAYAIAVLVALVLSGMILKENESTGVVSVNLTELHPRSLSIPSFPTTVDGFAALSSIGSVLESGVAGAAGQATSALGSAIGAAESAVAQAIPRNITIGTRRLCAGYTTHIECEPYPLNDSSGLSTLGAQFDPVAAYLRHALPMYITIVVGFALSLGSVLVSILAVFCFPWQYLVLLCNLAGLAFFAAGAAYAYIVGSLASAASGHFGITATKGVVARYLFCSVGFCSVAFFVGLFLLCKPHHN